MPHPNIALILAAAETLLGPLLYVLEGMYVDRKRLGALRENVQRFNVFQSPLVRYLVRHHHRFPLLDSIIGTALGRNLVALGSIRYLVPAGGF